MIDISIDLETLSSQPGASIASIGAVAVNELGEHSTFYAVVNDPTGHIDPGTIRWHLQQPNAAENVGVENVEGARDALQRFGEWLHKLGAHREGDARLWTHATFDMPILAAAYHRVGFSRAPWHYRNCRDLRTLYDLAGGRPVLPDNGGGHHALRDAEYQLGEVAECLGRLGQPIAPGAFVR